MESFSAAAGYYLVVSKTAGRDDPEHGPGMEKYIPVVLGLCGLNHHAYNVRDMLEREHRSLNLYFRDNIGTRNVYRQYVSMECTLIYLSDV